MPHGEADDPVRHRAVVERAVILDPSGVLSVSVQVAGGDVVVLAVDHPPQSAILLVSVGGGIYLAKYQKYHADEQQTASKDKNEDGRTQREDTCIDIVKNHTFPCVVYGPKPGDSEKYTEYDLRAQQEMAEWAFGMVVVSALGVLVTALATIYVALTFNETRKTLAAAERTNQLTQEGFRAEHRAWLRIDGLTWSYIGQLSDGQVSLAAKSKLSMTNTGRSPAHDAVVYVAFMGRLPERFDRSFRFDHRKKITTLLPGGMHHDMDHWKIDNDLLLGKELYVVTSIKYGAHIGLTGSTTNTFKIDIETFSATPVQADKLGWPVAAR